MSDIKITIKIKDKPNLLANATVSFSTTVFGFVTIKNFAIWKSKYFNQRLNDQVNIEPPAQISYGKAYRLIFFETRDCWYELEQQIYEAYCSARTSPAEEIDPDDIELGIEEMKRTKNNEIHY